ncbi:hypothetical protein [Dyella nitratireducens]|uniref:Amino acid permease n=1 Tax=Dyella nitratireducens TaxID=1849580 RepID=A0ABQ1FQH1_9GAMM|nr:hypothetical protein [Dyella nitratireducens]GGA26422.1 hypothetical protein GCM10010981_13850 [Dyella nitratireducens]GLQ43551.1 hypothetical protein GCM10007902_34010 [Dyella nitratireducens]
MPRFSLKQYQPRVMIAMAIYAAFMLFVWPLVNTTTSLPIKALLAVAATVPVLYVIGQMARLIRNSDELERHMHLVALSTATAVVSALTFIAGFLAAAGAVKLDGWMLLLVYPAVVLCYGAVRWRMVRNYGGSSLCSEELGVKPYLYPLLFGMVLLVVALAYPGNLDDARLGFLYGTAAGLIAVGGLPIVRHWYRRKYRHE